MAYIDGNAVHIHVYIEREGDGGPGLKRLMNWVLLLRKVTKDFALSQVKSFGFGWNANSSCFNELARQLFNWMTIKKVEICRMETYL